MTLPNWLEPAHARITIPVVLALGYALYHWLKWRYEKAKKLREEEVLYDHPIAAGRPASEGTVESAASIQPPPPVNPEDIVDPAVAAEAERLWTEACGITHQKAADFSSDWRYLTLLYQSAELGSLLAMSKLGDHAYAREDLVEAFYWKLRVEMKGGVVRNPSTSEILQAWMQAGCPEEYENETTGFSEQKGSFARAVLCLRGGIDLFGARIQLNDLIAAGNADAISFLHRKVGYSPLRD